MVKKIHVRDNSLHVKEGDIFVAVKGEKTDGHDYINAAIQNGAKIIYYEQGRSLSNIPSDVITHAVEDTRLQLAEECRKFYNVPKNLVAITGTSGKSSVVDFIRQLWEMNGIKCASIGTLGVQCSAVDIAMTKGNALTSLPTVALHRALHELAEAGITHVAMEASSHGLQQKRLHGLRFDVAAFTNLSRDHLDYHEDMASYFKAKSVLFAELLNDNAKVIANKDSCYFDAVERIAGKAYSFGANPKSDVYLKQVEESHQGMDMDVRFFGNDYKINTPLIGRFQAENMLVAASVLHFMNMDDDKIMSGLGNLQGVAGRMQRVACGDGQVVVDYAHKPEALKFALQALRPYAKGKLICLFGCGGNRDKGKRAQMGNISSDLADITIITDDNPRDENPATIRQEILQAVTEEHTEIADRKAAISEGIALLKKHKDSVLLIAGKGHESGQIIGDKTLPFDDVAVATEIIKA